MTIDRLETVGRNAEEWAWISGYIRSHADPHVIARIAGPGLAQGLSKDDLVHLLKALKRMPDGDKLISNMRSALRVRRTRSNGRESCTFVVASATKAKLKTLSVRCSMTETAIIERLIQDADQTDARYKRHLIQQKAEEKVARHEDKQALIKCKLELEETTEHLRACIQLLAEWEAAMGDTLPPSSDCMDASNELARKKMNVTFKEIEIAVLKRIVLSPRTALRDRYPGRTL